MLNISPKKDLIWKVSSVLSIKRLALSGPVYSWSEKGVLWYPLVALVDSDSPQPFVSEPTKKMRAASGAADSESVRRTAPRVWGGSDGHEVLTILTYIRFCAKLLPGDKSLFP